MAVPDRAAPQADVVNKPYIPPAPRSFIKEEKWYIQERGRAVEMTPTRRRNYQRRYGRAQRALNALDIGLVRPQQLEKTPSQLQRTVQRLTANPIITTGRSNEQQEPAQPRRSVFSRMATRDVSLSPKRPVQGSNRLEAFFYKASKRRKYFKRRQFQ